MVATLRNCIGRIEAAQTHRIAGRRAIKKN
jgi:hypothetical protein